MVNCMSCSSLVIESDNFCRGCGFELPDTECFECDCGSRVGAADKHCFHCGTEFDGIIEVEGDDDEDDDEEDDTEEESVQGTVITS